MVCSFISFYFRSKNTYNLSSNFNHLHIKKFKNCWHKSFKIFGTVRVWESLWNLNILGCCFCFFTSKVHSIIIFFLVRENTIPFSLIYVGCPSRNDIFFPGTSWSVFVHSQSFLFPHVVLSLIPVQTFHNFSLFVSPIKFLFP